MVERKTTRDFKVDGDDYIAIKRDEYMNSRGKKIIQTIEEHNITSEEIDEVINKLAEEELTKVNKEKEKVLTEINKIWDEIKDVVKDPKYIKFKTKLNSDKIKGYIDVLSKENQMQKFEQQLKEFDNTILDVHAWKKQFQGLKSEINKSKVKQS